MHNAKVRFAIDDDGSIYDYKTSISYAPVGELDDGSGVWNLPLIKQLILNDQHVEAAYTRHAVTPATDDKVEQANASFMNEPALTDPVIAPEAPNTPDGEPVIEAEKDDDAENKPE